MKQKKCCCIYIQWKNPVHSLWVMTVFFPMFIQSVTEKFQQIWIHQDCSTPKQCSGGGMTAWMLKGFLSHSPQLLWTLWGPYTPALWANSAKHRGSSQSLRGSSTSLRDYFIMADMPQGDTGKITPDASPLLSYAFSPALYLTSRDRSGPCRPPSAGSGVPCRGLR